MEIEDKECKDLVQKTPYKTMVSLVAIVIFTTIRFCGSNEDVIDEVYLHWDDQIVINEKCDRIWSDMRDYRLFVEIIFPHVSPIWFKGKANEIDATVRFVIDGVTVDEHIILLNNDKMYLSFVLTQGFDLFITYRGEWYLKRIDGQDNKCEFHKGSHAIRNESSSWTNREYKQTVKEELQSVKRHYEDNKSKKDL